MDRRHFLKILALSSASMIYNPRFSWAAGEPGSKDPILVTIFLRGAMDGVSFLPPIDDPNYFLMRPNIAIRNMGTAAATTPSSAAVAIPPELKLKDGFALHPALTEIRQIFNRGEASLFFEAGSLANTRSHFDAQDWMESGTLQMGANESGFLGRAAAGVTNPKAGLSVVAIQNGLPRILKGSAVGVAFPDFKALKLAGPLTRDKLGGGSESDKGLDPAILKLYGQSEDPLFHSAAQSFLQGSSVLQKAEQLFDQEKMALPKGNLAKNLAQISAMIRSDVGLKMAVTEMGGWDTHVNQGNAEKGSLKDRFVELDAAIGSFWKSIEAHKDQVCIVVMTEFGRTAAENGDRGTDHGHGSTFMVINGKVKSQKIYQQFKGFSKEHLHENRDLDVKFDYREIFLEVLQKHSKLAVDAKTLFPGFVSTGELGLFRS